MEKHVNIYMFIINVRILCKLKICITCCNLGNCIMRNSQVFGIETHSISYTNWTHRIQKNRTNERNENNNINLNINALMMTIFSVVLFLFCHLEFILSFIMICCCCSCSLGFFFSGVYVFSPKFSFLLFKIYVCTEEVENTFFALFLAFYST